MRVLVFCLVLACNKISFFSGGIGDKDKQPPKPPPIDNEETFTPGVVVRSPLDILVVIDNSSSMTVVHQGLSDKLDVLLGQIKDSDWQIALTTTDPRDCPQTIITAATPDYQHVFRAAVIGLGTGGAVLEQATRAAMLGLQKDCRGKAWLRDNSAIAILIVTDEDNFERGPCGMVDASGLSVISPLDDRECHVAALHAYLQKIRIAGVTAKVYGLINTSNNGAHSKNFLTWKDSKGKQIFDHYASVHDKDYRATLSKISQHIYNVLQNRFVLQKTHPHKTAQIYLTSGTAEHLLTADDYVIDGNILTLNTAAIPPDTSSIKVVWTELP